MSYKDERLEGKERKKTERMMEKKAREIMNKDKIVRRRHKKSIKENRTTK